MRLIENLEIVSSENLDALSVLISFIQWLTNTTPVIKEQASLMHKLNCAVR